MYVELRNEGNVSIQVEPWREGPLQEDRGVSDLRQGEERLPDLPPRPHIRPPSAGKVLPTTLG